jgi:hypothetical protein
MATRVELPLTGGCLCHRVRYALNAAPFLLYVCHCTDCQRQSGSAFGMSMPAPRTALTVTAGEPATYRRTMTSGRVSCVRFCGTCGTRVFAEPGTDFSEIVVVRPGTLDDTRWLKPAAQMFTRSAHSWACLDDALDFETQPDQWDDIRRRFRAQDLEFTP